MNHIQHSNLIAAAIGVTVGVIGAAGVFIYQKMLEKQQHGSANSNLDNANKKIAELQAELEELRKTQQKKKRRAIVRKYTSNESTYTVTDNDTDIDAFSTADTDFGDEFYDCSDSESFPGDNDRVLEETSHLDLLRNIDQHQDEEFQIETYYKLRALLESRPNDVEIVWRFAKTCYDYSVVLTDINTKKEIIDEGINACKKIIEMKNPDLYKWYAILVGVNGDYLPTAEKIKNGYHFRDYIMMGLELRPDDCYLHHLLGRFKYEVASLSWFERKIAATLFSDPPVGTYEEAVTNFEDARNFGNTHSDNELYLGKAYIGLGQYDKAIDCFERLLERPAITKEEQKAHSEATILSNKYSKYRL